MSFQTRNSFKSLKTLTMTKGAFGVDLTIIVTCVIGICFRGLIGIWMILIAEGGMRNGGSRA